MTNGEPASEPRIRSLDASTIQRIAAGEVVERPASVVKELLENSLDAGATRIDVTVDCGGKDGIRVSDNGHGIAESELPHAVEEHATSKIADIEDLDSGVASLGFRGEALSTIGAVSRLTLRSRPQGETVGAELTVEGGEIGETKPAGCPEGTTVEVEALFFNTPARKKFLKRDSTEFDHINTVVSQYALANPDVAVSLSHNGRELFGTEGGGSLRSTVMSVYGREVAESMIEVDGSTEEPLESVSGLLSHPETTRSTREYLATFVNGRYVTDPALRRAVIDGYGGQLAPDRYPFAVLFVDVPAESVDVNVHPRKTEVRFDNDEAVLSGITHAVETTLIDDGLIRSTAPRGRSAPAETEVAPESNEKRVDGSTNTEQEQEPPDTTGTPTGPSSEETNTPTGPSTEATGEVDHQTDQTGQTDQTDQTNQTDQTDQTNQTVAEPLDPADEDSWAVDGLGGEPSAATSESTNPRSDMESVETRSSSVAEKSGTAADSPLAGQSTDNNTTPATQSAESNTPSASDPPTDDQSTTIEMGDAKPVETPQTKFDLVAAQSSSQSTAGPTTQQTLSGDETTDRQQYDTLPTLSVLGQLYDTYLLAESDEGLVLIDQHAADERVNYERLQNAIGNSSTSQRLANPVELELTAREAALFDGHTDALSEIGFEAERREARMVDVHAVPAVFSTTLDPELLREALLRFVESTDGASETLDEAVDELLADLACYPSITGNTSLTEGSVVDLLSALDDCANPYACPHGRPVIIEISREEIEDRFERDYPGHSGRRAE